MYLILASIAIVTGFVSVSPAVGFDINICHTAYSLSLVDCVSGKQETQTNRDPYSEYSYPYGGYTRSWKGKKVSEEDQSIPKEILEEDIPKEGDEKLTLQKLVAWPNYYDYGRNLDEGIYNNYWEKRQNCIIHTLLTFYECIASEHRGYKNLNDVADYAYSDSSLEAEDYVEEFEQYENYAYWDSSLEEEYYVEESEQYEDYAYWDSSLEEEYYVEDSEQYEDYAYWDSSLEEEYYVEESEQYEDYAYWDSSLEEEYYVEESEQYEGKLFTMGNDALINDFMEELFKYIKTRVPTVPEQ